MTSHANPVVGDANDPGAAKTRRRTQSVRAQLMACQRELDALAQEPVEGFHGQSYTAEQAEDRVEMLDRRIENDVDNKIHKHDPVNSGQRRLARLAPFADFLVFLYFLAVVLNVDWSDPRRTPEFAVVSLVLAVIATAGVAWTLRSIAARLRQDKPDDNRFHWRQRTRRGGVKEEQLMLVLILTAVGAVMAYRIYVDARDSDLAAAPSLLLAGFFALVTVSLNYVIFLVEFSDGSTVTDEVRHLGAQLESIHARRRALERTHRELEQQLQQLDELQKSQAGATSTSGLATDAKPGTAPVTGAPPNEPPAATSSTNGAERFTTAELKTQGSSDDRHRRGSRVDSGSDPAP